jgi:hypothetical protein
MACGGCVINQGGKFIQRCGVSHLSGLRTAKADWWVSVFIAKLEISKALSNTQLFFSALQRSFHESWAEHGSIKEQLERRPLRRVPFFWSVLHPLYLDATG